MKKKSKIYNPQWADYMKLWSVVEPPWRPSKKDVAFCEKMIKMILQKEKNPKALIFGSTPEIRDILAKYKIETTAIDMNLGMRMAMSKMMKRKNFKEKYLKDNWLTVKLPQNYFDLVFDDGCFCNLSFNTWTKFIFQIKGAMKKDGLYYSGEWIYQVKNPWTFNDLIKKYKKDPEFFKDFKDRVYSLLRLIYEPGIYNKKKHELYFEKIAEGLNEFVKNGDIKERDIKKIQWTKYDTGAYIEVGLDDIKSNDKILKKHFKIIDIFQDKSHPLMIFRRDYILAKK
jgi:hypothetical protein